VTGSLGASCCGRRPEPPPVGRMSWRVGWGRAGTAGEPPERWRVLREPAP
jgi:hypothetical protein